MKDLLDELFGERDRRGRLKNKCSDCGHYFCWCDFTMRPFNKKELPPLEKQEWYRELKQFEAMLDAVRYVKLLF